MALDSETLLKHQPAQNDSGDRIVGCWGCEWMPSYKLETEGTPSWNQFVEHLACL